MATKTYSERVFQGISLSGVTDYFIWNNCDAISKAQMSHIRTGKGGASLSIIESLCNNFPQVNANYILTGRGSMFLENKISALSEERKEDDSDVSLTYDELSRLHKTTVLRYERLFKNLKSEFEKLKETFIKVDGELNKTLEDVRAITKKQKIA